MTPQTVTHSIQSVKRSETILQLTPESSINFYSSPSIQNGTLFLNQNMLLFVIQGSINLRYGSAIYEIAQNEMCILRKSMLIEYCANTNEMSEGKVEYIMIYIDREVVKEFLKLSDFIAVTPDENISVKVETCEGSIRHYLNSLQPYFNEMPKISTNLIKLKMLELLFNLYNFKKQMLQPLLDVRTVYTPNITTTVEESLLDSLSVDQLAVKAGRSLSSFRRDFMAIYNMPPSQWIRKKRLEKAKELLLSSTMTVTDVCYTLGFESIAHFSRLFKSHFSCSPSEFRLKGESKKCA